MENTVILEEYAKSRSRRTGLLKKYGVTLLFLFPFITAFLMFFVYPLFYGIYISMTDFKYGIPGQESFNSFNWYKIILGIGASNKITENFWNSFSNSLIFSIIMVPIAILVPLALAILVNKKPAGFKLFRTLIYLPSIVPLTASSAIFVMLFNPLPQHGLSAEVCNLLGTPVNFDWFIDVMFKFNFFGKEVEVVYAWIPIFLMCFWGGWGGNFIILSAGLENVPKSLYEASSIDGCSSFKKILHVTIPGIKGQLVLCLFTTIIGYLGLYGQNYVLTDANPNKTTLPGSGSTSTVMFFIQDIVANNLNLRGSVYGLGAAASIVFAIFVGIISGIQMYITRDKKTGTKISERYAKWKLAKSH